MQTISVVSETELGARIMELCTARGITLRQLAATTKLSEYQLREARRYNPRLMRTGRFWERISALLGLTVAAAQTLAQTITPQEEEQRAAIPQAADPPAPLQLAGYRPVITQVGVKYYPTVHTRMTGCERCPWLTLCNAVVAAHDGYALCEDIIPADVPLPAAQAAQIKQRGNWLSNAQAAHLWQQGDDTDAR